MIDPKELRIGNYLLSGGVAIQIDAAHLCDLLTSEYYLLGHTQIPITPEWLERLGFEKRESSTCDEWWNGINEVTHDWLVSLTWLHRPELTDAPNFPFYRNGKHTIKHVHQLQNLYFALTGQELTIKQ